MKFTGERFIPGIYDDTPMAYEHWQRYITANKLVKDKVVLDIACGEGYGSHLMAQSAFQVYGLDISGEAIEHALNKYVRDNLTYQCGSVDKLDFADESIDIIISFETIEHVDVEMQKAFLREAKRILTKDGILLISCPNKKVATDFAWDVLQYKNEFHIKEYYIEEFQTFLKSYFNHVQLAFQRYEVALLLSSSHVADLEVVLNTDKDFEHTQNIIALCSNSQIEHTNLDSIVLDNQGNYLKNIATIADLQKHSNALQSINDDLQNQIDQLQSQVNEIQANNKDLEFKNTDLHNQIDQLQGQVNELQANNKDLEVKNTDLKSQNVILQNLADELQRIYKTRSWKLLNTAYNIKSKFLK